MVISPRLVARVPQKESLLLPTGVGYLKLFVRLLSGGGIF